MEIVFGAFIWVCVALLSGAIAKEKGRSFFLWFVFGVFLGCVALVLAAVVPSIKKKD